MRARWLSGSRAFEVSALKSRGFLSVASAQKAAEARAVADPKPAPTPFSGLSDVASQASRTWQEVQERFAEAVRAGRTRLHNESIAELLYSENAQAFLEHCDQVVFQERIGEALWRFAENKKNQANRTGHGILACPQRHLINQWSNHRFSTTCKSRQDFRDRLSKIYTENALFPPASLGHNMEIFGRIAWYVDPNTEDRLFYLSELFHTDVNFGQLLFQKLSRIRTLMRQHKGNLTTPILNEMHSLYDDLRNLILLDEVWKWLILQGKHGQPPPVVCEDELLKAVGTFTVKDSSDFVNRVKAIMTGDLPCEYLKAFQGEDGKYYFSPLSRQSLGAQKTSALAGRWEKLKMLQESTSENLDAQFEELFHECSWIQNRTMFNEQLFCDLFWTWVEKGRPPEQAFKTMLLFCKSDEQASLLRRQPMAMRVFETLLARHPNASLSGAIFRNLAQAATLAGNPTDVLTIARKCLNETTSKIDGRRGTPPKALPHVLVLLAEAVRTAPRDAIAPIAPALKGFVARVRSTVDERLIPSRAIFDLLATLEPEQKANLRVLEPDVEKLEHRLLEAPDDLIAALDLVSICHRTGQHHRVVQLAKTLGFANLRLDRAKLFEADRIEEVFARRLMWSAEQCISQPGIAVECIKLALNLTAESSMKPYLLRKKTPQLLYDLCQRAKSTAPFEEVMDFVTRHPELELEHSMVLKYLRALVRYGDLAQEPPLDLLSVVTKDGSTPPLGAYNGLLKYLLLHSAYTDLPPIQAFPPPPGTFETCYPKPTSMDVSNETTRALKDAYRLFEGIVRAGLQPNLDTFKILLDLHVYHRDMNGAFSVIERMARLNIKLDPVCVEMLSDLFVDQAVLEPVLERLEKPARDDAHNKLKYFVGKLQREPVGVILHYMRVERRSNLISLPFRQGFFPYFPRLQSVMAIAIDRLETVMPQLLDEDGFDHLQPAVHDYIKNNLPEQQPIFQLRPVYYRRAVLDSIKENARSVERASSQKECTGLLRAITSTVSSLNPPDLSIAQLKDLLKTPDLSTFISIAPPRAPSRHHGGLSPRLAAAFSTKSTEGNLPPLPTAVEQRSAVAHNQPSTLLALARMREGKFHRYKSRLKIEEVATPDLGFAYDDIHFKYWDKWQKLLPTILPGHNRESPVPRDRHHHDQTLFTHRPEFTSMKNVKARNFFILDTIKASLNANTILKVCESHKSAMNYTHAHCAIHALAMETHHHPEGSWDHINESGTVIDKLFETVATGFYKLEKMPNPGNFLVSLHWAGLALRYENQAFWEHLLQVIRENFHNLSPANLAMMYSALTRFGLTEEPFGRFVGDVVIQVMGQIPSHEQKTLLEALAESPTKIRPDLLATLEDRVVATSKDMSPKQISSMWNTLSRINGINSKPFDSFAEEMLYRENVDDKFTPSQLLQIVKSIGKTGYYNIDLIRGLRFGALGREKLVLWTDEQFAELEEQCKHFPPLRFLLHAVDRRGTRTDSNPSRAKER